MKAILCSTLLVFSLLFAAEVRADDLQPTVEALVYYDGSPLLQEVYSKAIEGLAANPNLTITNTADASVFDAAMRTGEYAVMAAITMDATAVQSWLNQNPPISVLVTAAPTADGEVIATVRLIPPEFGDVSQLPVDPTPPTGSTPPDEDSGGSLPTPDPTAPGYEPPSGNGGGGMFCIIASSEPKKGLLDRAKDKLDDVVDGVGELSEKARKWLQKKMNKIATALRQMEGGEFTVTVTMPIPGGGSITISRKGTGAQAGELVEKLTEVILY